MAGTAARRADVNYEDVDRVISRAAAAGYDLNDATVIEFLKWGSVPESTIGSEYDEALEDALTEIVDDLGIEII